MDEWTGETLKETCEICLDMIEHHSVFINDDIMLLIKHFEIMSKSQLRSFPRIFLCFRSVGGIPPSLRPTKNGRLGDVSLEQMGWVSPYLDSSREGFVRIKGDRIRGFFHPNISH